LSQVGEMPHFVAARIYAYRRRYGHWHDECQPSGRSIEHRECCLRRTCDRAMRSALNVSERVQRRRYCDAALKPKALIRRCIGPDGRYESAFTQHTSGPRGLPGRSRGIV